MEQKFNLMEVLAKDPSTLSIEELNFIMTFEKATRAAAKVAKSKGLTPAKVAAVRPEELTVLASAFEPIVMANVDVISKLFGATKTEDKPLGQKGLLITTGKDCPFNIQFLNKAVFVEEARIAKAERKIKADEKELESLLKKADATDADKERIKVLEAEKAAREEAAEAAKAEKAE